MNRCAFSMVGRFPRQRTARQPSWHDAAPCRQHLDAKQIYHTLSPNPELEKNTMSVAEQLKADGRLEGISQGISKGLWVGRIQSLQELLGITVTSREDLEMLILESLEAQHGNLHLEYKARFKS